MVTGIYFQLTSGINKSNKKDLILFITLLLQDRIHKNISRQILLNSSADLKTSTNIKLTDYTLKDINDYTLTGDLESLRE